VSQWVHYSSLVQACTAGTVLLGAPAPGVVHLERREGHARGAVNFRKWCSTQQGDNPRVASLACFDCICVAILCNLCCSEIELCAVVVGRGSLLHRLEGCCNMPYHNMDWLAPLCWLLFSHTQIELWL
jgi:hypothetical protein